MGFVKSLRSLVNAKGEALGDLAAARRLAFSVIRDLGAAERSGSEPVECVCCGVLSVGGAAKAALDKWKILAPDFNTEDELGVCPGCRKEASDG